MLEQLVRNLTDRKQRAGRFDCPFCGGENTLSVSYIQGVWLARCFRASCNERRRIAGELTTESLKQRLGSRSPAKVKFSLPTWFSKDIDKKFDYYIDRYHLRDVDLYHDKKLDRLVFPLYNRYKDLSLAVGRSLHGAPKWYMYGPGDGHIVFPCLVTPPTNAILVVVEDTVSAVRLNRLVATSPLLGTNLPECIAEDASAYKQVVLALDKDATLKSLKLRKSLAGVVPVRVALLTKDIKDMSDDEFNLFLKEYINGRAERSSVNQTSVNS